MLSKPYHVESQEGGEVDGLEGIFRQNPIREVQVRGRGSRFGFDRAGKYQGSARGWPEGCAEIGRRQRNKKKSKAKSGNGFQRKGKGGGRKGKRQGLKID